MKTKLLLLSSFLIILIACGENYQTPENLQYSIINKTVTPGTYNANFEVELSRKIDSIELSDLSHVIKDISEDYSQLFINYTVPPISTKNSYASASFTDSGYDQSINSSSPVQDKLMLNSLNHIKNLKAAWEFKEFNIFLALHMNDTTKQLTTIFKDGSTMVDTVQAMGNYSFSIKDGFKESYIINEDNNLEYTAESGDVYVGQLIAW